MEKGGGKGGEGRGKEIEVGIMLCKAGRVGISDAYTGRYNS